jgi:hypothetical protein
MARSGYIQLRQLHQQVLHLAVAPSCDRVLTASALTTNVRRVRGRAGGGAPHTHLGGGLREERQWQSRCGRGG